MQNVMALEYDTQKIRYPSGFFTCNKENDLRKYLN